MRRIAVLVVLAVLPALLLSGCVADDPSETADSDSDEDAADDADIPLRTWSVEQSGAENDTVVKVTGMVINTGEEPANASMTVALLDGEDTVAERDVDVGSVGTEEHVEFSVDFDVSPSETDGRKITFNPV